MTKEKKNFDGDPLGSTYMRITYLKNGIIWKGYSKEKDIKYFDKESNQWITKVKNEKHDKMGLLCNWILREYKNGYLQINHPHKSELDRMEFYWHSPFGSLQYLPIVTLYYTFPDWDNSAWYGRKEFEEFEKWISRFYKLIKMQSSYDEMHRLLFYQREAKLQNKSARDPFSTKHKRFSTVEDLNAFCSTLRDLHPRGEIMHFYNEYKAKYFNL
jgi:hypothetical protein